MKNQKKENISKDRAIDLLFEESPILMSSNQKTCDYLDEYGNYVFLTDMVISEPNTAYGSSEGCNYSFVLNTAFNN